MKVLILIVLLAICQTQNVISRNQKVTEMINELKENQQMYDQLITQVDQKMKSDYDECTNQIKDLNCSNSEIWQQQRSKNSKNITNLQQKIKKHNQTIDAILQLNKHEVTKQNLTMVKLFPKIEKVKNDIELIENMMFLIEDTYLNLDAAGKSILLLFDHQFEHPKAQQMQKSFIQLMNSKAQQEAEPASEQASEPAGEPTEEGSEKDSKQNANEEQTSEGSEEGSEGNSSQPSDQVPLIDEDIFDGEVDKSEVEVSNLFAPTEEEERKIYADKIPEGVNVKEHDANKYEEIMPEKEEQEKTDQFEDLRIYEVKEDFKSQIKELGRGMHEELGLVLDGLNNELSQLTQSVADLEKAIMDLHHKHAKQIVQIYMETKKLQQKIFELDDDILSLDASIFDCSNSNEKLEFCETRKGMDQIVLDDLKTEKSFNEGVLKELDKLLQFADKNVYEPEPMQPVENVQVDIEPKSQDEADKDQQNEAIQQRIASIKEEEKLVEQQLQQQNQDQMISEQQAPEHLTEVPEIQQEVQPEAIAENENPDVKRDEDEVLKQVEEELKEEQQALGEENIPQEEKAPAEPENPQTEQTLEPEPEPILEPETITEPETTTEPEPTTEPEVALEPETAPEPKLELLRKNKKK